MRRSEMSLLLGVLLAAVLEAEAQAGATCFAGNSSFPLQGDPECSGDSSGPSGCICQGNNFIPCLASATCDPTTTPCCPPYFYWHSDLTCCSETVNCAPACYDDEECISQAGVAVCQCNSTTYLHANRSDITPTTECESSTIAITFSKCLLQRFKYDTGNMYLSDTNYSVVVYEDIAANKRVLKAQVLTKNGWHGNQVTVNSNDKKMTYSNVLYVPPNSTDGFIISNTLRINFSCTYNLTMQTSLQTVLNPILGTVTLPSVNGSGPIDVTMAAYMSDSFTNPYSVGTTLTVGTPLYIGMSTTFSDGDKFTLRADKCVASPNNNPSQGGVTLISGGCPVTDAVGVQVLHNGDSLQVMFQLQTFVFQGQSAVYMSCDISLCPKTTPDTCGCSLSRSAGLSTTSVQLGPVGLTGSIDINSGSHTDVSLWAVLGSSILALLSLRMI